MPAHLIFDLDKLHERADEVNPLDAKGTCLSLKAKLTKYKEIIALCGPQIGVSERVIAIKFNNNVIKFFINPKILESTGLHLVREKDITIAEKEFICLRPNKILVEYQTEEAKPEQNYLEGPVAEIFDRMQNYLDGITMEDWGLEVLEGFDECDQEEKDAIINLYLESLKKRQALLDENIENDKDAKELKDAIRFMEAVDKGEVTLVPREEVGL